jgi:hypothetical protein
MLHANENFWPWERSSRNSISPAGAFHSTCCWALSTSAHRYMHALTTKLDSQTVCAPNWPTLAITAWDDELHETWPLTLMLHCTQTHNIHQSQKYNRLFSKSKIKYIICSFLRANPSKRMLCIHPALSTWWITLAGYEINCWNASEVVTEPAVCNALLMRPIKLVLAANNAKCKTMRQPVACATLIPMHWRARSASSTAM